MNPELFPFGSLAGSTMRELGRVNAVASYELRKALEAMVEAAPHPRDYIGQDERYQAARSEHLTNIKTIRDLTNAYEEKAMYCFAREPR